MGMKKLYDLSLDNGGNTVISKKGEPVRNASEGFEAIRGMCSKRVGKDERGVVVYMSREEYKDYKDLSEIANVAKSLFR